MYKFSKKWAVQNSTVADGGRRAAAWLSVRSCSGGVMGGPFIGRPAGELVRDNCRSHQIPELFDKWGYAALGSVLVGSVASSAWRTARARSILRNGLFSNTTPAGASPLCRTSFSA